MPDFELSGIIVDVLNSRQYSGTLEIRNGKIHRIREEPHVTGHYILPGFVDAHVHIESSMLTPSEFAKAAVVHGTVSTISDPHEIANVLGIAGVDFMIDNGKQVPFHFHFGAPSCVPATAFETAGATLDAAQVEQLLMRQDIFYLAEMMNYPGVLHHDAEVWAKLAAAKRLNKPVDGHAPGLRGAQATAYIQAGISTDHECVTLDEAREKVLQGMKILIREGSAAKNFDALWPLLLEFPQMVMLCSDDKHPDDLLEGHINLLVKRAIAHGVSLQHALQAACVNPVLHYNAQVGLLQQGDTADFIVVDNLTDLNVLQTYIRGLLVANRGDSLIKTRPVENCPNVFLAQAIQSEQLALIAKSPRIRVIQAANQQLITEQIQVSAKLERDFVVSDTTQDVLKLVVYNRYAPDTKLAIAFCRGFGLKQGALASTVAHDSHNVIAIGVSDEDIAAAINLLVEAKGGISIAGDGLKHVLPLPIAGLMATESAERVAKKYMQLNAIASEWGSKLPAPYMTLSFLALLVIPKLKLSDKGLFNGESFEFVDCFV